MARSIGPRIGVDGEEEYRKQINQIIEQAKTLDAQMNAVTASFGKNTIAEEKAAKISGILAQQIEASEKRTALLRDMVEKSAAVKGKDAQETLKWQQALYAAEEPLNKLRKEQDELNRAIEENNSVLKKIEDEIKNLNLDNDVLSASLRALNAQYADEEDKKALLIEQNKIYTKQLDIQEEKLHKLYDALTEARNKYGENSEEVKRLSIEISNTAEGIYKTENAISRNNAELTGSLDEVGDAIEQAEKKTGGFGDQLDGLAGKLGLNVPDAAKQALNRIEGFSTGTVAQMGAVATAVAAVVKVTKELSAMTDEAATKADDLLTKSITTGLSTTQLQQMRYAAPFIDADESTLTSAMSRIPRVVAQAQEQFEAYNAAAQKAAEEGKNLTATLGTQASAFETLKVSAVDANGELRDSREVTWELLEALGNVGNQTEADAIANDLFGKSYADLKPLIQNAEEAQRLYNEALDSGYVLSEEQLRILGEVDDAHQALTLTQEKNKNLIATQWAPANKAAYEELAKLTDMAGKALIDSGLVSNLASVVESTASLIDAGTDLVSALPGWTNPIEQVSDSFRGLAVIMATIADTANVISGLMTFDFSRVKTGLGWNISNGQMSNLQKLQRSGSDYVSYNAAGTENWRGGLTWVGESGPEIVALPSGSRIYSNEESRRIAGGDVYNITIDAGSVQEFNDIVRIAKSARTRRRMQ